MSDLPAGTPPTEHDIDYELASRLDAFRSMLCVLVREELQREYTLNLGEMYLLIDGIPAMRRLPGDET